MDKISREKDVLYWRYYNIIVSHVVFVYFFIFFSYFGMTSRERERERERRFFDIGEPPLS